MLSELVRLDSFPDVWLLFGGGGKFPRCYGGLREATWRQNATSSDLILCCHVEFVVFCSDSQYRHLFVPELPLDIRFYVDILNLIGMVFASVLDCKIWTPYHLNNYERANYIVSITQLQLP